MCSAPWVSPVEVSVKDGEGRGRKDYTQWYTYYFVFGKESMEDDVDHLKKE